MKNHSRPEIEPTPPSGFSLVDLVSSRFVALGDESAMQHYHWLEQFEQSCRQSARLNKGDLLNLWQRALRVLMHPFMPGSTHDYRHAGETLDEWSRYFSSEYRMLVCAQATRTAKVALDAALDGYYSQSLALSRRLHESYKRCVYVRVRPREVYRWLPDSMVGPEVHSIPEFDPPKCDPSKNDWVTLFASAEAQDPATVVSGRLLEVAQGHMNYLNAHAHPDLEGATDLMDSATGELDRTKLNLAPFYSSMHLDRAIHANISALFLLLLEVAYLDTIDDQWRSAHADWLHHFECLVITA